MLKVTAASEVVLRLTVKLAVVVPLSPSATLTSLIVSTGCVAVQAWNAEAVLRGAGVRAEKSVLLLSVSVQPKSPRTAAVVTVVAGAAALPSK